MKTKKTKPQPKRKNDDEKKSNDNHIAERDQIQKKSLALALWLSG